MLTIPTAISVWSRGHQTCSTYAATWKRKELEHSLTPYTKINSKCIKDLHVRPDTIKLLEKNRQNMDINCSHIIDLPPRVMEIKPKTNKRDLIILKIFCTAKKTINKMKRQLTEWEKLFANNMTDKGLVSKIYKHLM